MNFIELTGAVFLGTVAADVLLAAYSTIRARRIQKERMTRLLELKADYEAQVAKARTNETALD